MPDGAAGVHRPELAVPHKVLATLDSLDRRNIDNALGDAEEELAKSKPDVQEIGKALDRPLNHSKTAGGCAQAMGPMKSAHPPMKILPTTPFLIMVVYSVVF